MTQNFNLASKEEIREAAEQRARVAVDFLRDHAVFAAPPIARWISAAPARANRRKALHYVLALDAARVTNADAIRRVGVSAVAVKKWRADLAALKAADAAIEEAVASAVDDARDAISAEARRRRGIKPIAIPKEWHR